MAVSHMWPLKQQQWLTWQSAVRNTSKPTRTKLEGQRKERKRDDEEENTRVRETAQPGDDTRGEPSHAASHYYCSRDISTISAEAKLSSTQKRNFYDFGIETKRERDPG